MSAMAPNLGSMTPSSPPVNGLVIASGKTLTVNNTMTLAAGADGQTFTFPSTSATIARTDAAQTFSGANTFDTILTVSAAGAASTASELFSGALFTGGTATTTFPQMLFQPTGTAAVTSWSTAGTIIGANVVSGFTGNFLDFHKAGAASVFSVAQNGVVSGAAFQASGGAGAFSGSSDSASLRFGASNDTILSRVAAATWQCGGANAASPVAQTVQAQGSRAGTDTNTGGANLTIAPGTGTGTGTLSSLVLQSPVAVASGSGAQTQTTGLAIKAGAAILTNYTVANLPAAATAGAGALAFVTDATQTAILGLGLAVVGGGANKVVVYSDGTNWLII